MCGQRGLLASICAAVILHASAAAAQSVSYVYDELGRLIAVTDPAGDTAIYTYDALGNVVSITRQSSAVLSIIRFTPGSGPVGQVVTVYGTGFAATPGDNTVSVNGTAAPVTSAAATQLVITVPTGATTGPISVTTPGGSVQSATSFMVTAPGQGSPTITGFSPALADVGTATTITCTNFDSVPSNNRPAFNVAAAAAVARRPTTQISTSVPPGATSGRVRVVTPSGQAQSSADFFVPPPPFLAADVVFTGRMAPNGSAFSAPVNTASKIALVVFDATAGHRVNLKTQGPAGAATINQPGGSYFHGTSVGILASYSEPREISTTGTYTILVDPAGTATGTATLTVYDVPPDVTGTMTADGSPKGVTLSTPGQNAHLTLAGTADQRVSLKASGGPTGALRINNPDATVLASASITFLPSFIDTTVLPATGTYSVDVDPSGGNTGSVTLNLYEVPPDFTGTIVAGGSPVTLPLTTPGQNGWLTFSGTTAERISLKVSSGPTGTVQIRNPDDSTLASVSMGSIAAFLEPVVLAASGTYKIFVNPSTFNAGSVTLTLYDAPPDASGTLTVNGGAIPVALTPGQNGSYTFAGTGGQAVTVRVTGNTMGLVTVKLLAPGGAQLTSSSSLLGSFNLAQQTLPSTGTYTVVVDPSGSNAGSLNLAVTTP